MAVRLSICNMIANCYSSELLYLTLLRIIITFDLDTVICFANATRKRLSSVEELEGGSQTLI